MNLRDDSFVTTAFDVAITVIRLMPEAVFSGTPRPTFRRGMRKTPPPMPSSAPRDPATAPASIMPTTMRCQ